MLKKKVYKAISVLVIISFVFCPRYGMALPTGEQVVAGQAEFERSGDTMNVNVSTDKMIANYNSFSIAAQEAVHFHQPSASSVALNRVIGADASSIFGTLTANGRIFLINPNGILFAPGSQVNAAGLVASTLNISDADFLAGRYTFYGASGSVVNQGYISAPGGYAALLGSTVENTGVIEANLGSIALASGEKITLNLDPRGLIQVVIDEATSQNLEHKDDAVKNSGRITADGGKVILTAKALDGVFKRAVNNEGVIEAKSLVDGKGEVYLLADKENSLTSTTGTIDVSAKDVGANGGFVEISGKYVTIDGIIDVTSLYGEAGELLIDPVDLWILDIGWPYPNPLGIVRADWLENFDGNLTMQTERDIYLRIIDDNLNLKKFTSGRYFRLEAGRDIDLGDNTITTYGGRIELYADYNKNGSGQVKWNIPEPLEFFNGWNGGLKSNGGDIILSGADVDLRYDFGWLFGGEQIVSIDAGNGTVYFAPSTQGKNVSWTRGWQANDYDFVLSAQGLENITAGKIVIGTDNEASGAIGGNISIDGMLDLNKSTKLALFSRGQILSNNLDPFDIKVNSLILSATNGIGSANALRTQVSNLQARNSASGNIKVSNEGGLTLTDLSGWGYAILNSGSGNVDIQAHSSINVKDPIRTKGGDVSLTAEDDITHYVNGDVMTDGGDFVGNAGLDYTLKDGANIITEDGVIDILAGRDILLGDNSLDLVSDFTLNYIGGTRGFELLESNWTVKNGILTFHIKIQENSFDGNLGAIHDYYSNPALNEDLKDHFRVDQNGNIVFGWEDLYELSGLLNHAGEPDYDDVLYEYVKLGGETRYLGANLISNSNIFLTA